VIIYQVYLFGATVTSYRTPADREVLFVSRGAIFDGKKGTTYSDLGPG
jgi:D-hexose-6-phosphate mutarotase